MIWWLCEELLNSPRTQSVTSPPGEDLGKAPAYGVCIFPVLPFAATPVAAYSHTRRRYPLALHIVIVAPFATEGAQRPQPGPDIFPADVGRRASVDGLGFLR